ncbi:MAG: DNA endonuclease SmrA [Cellvibrionales bacterium TMED49]|nr:MAG: DNA endonuclease SmrA [Cellvibrionales bacterium TMED49]|tara:strand:- start:259 stop:882 length:624 start_codon:yes stop_codon:yes gene_type:complete
MPTSDFADDSIGKTFGELFGEVVQPLGDKGATFVKSNTKKTPGMAMRHKSAQEDIIVDANFLDPLAYIEDIEALDIITHCRAGVQHGVFKKMRLGRYDLQARLDLHRHSVEQARRAVWRFVGDCRQKGARYVLIIHGKTKGKSKPAVLKSCINHWLRQLDDVLAFHTAQKHHGGAGATYILIKKGLVSRVLTAEKLDQSRRKKSSNF